MPPTEVKLQQRRYTNSDRKTIIGQFHASGCANERQFCRDVGIPYGTWQGWRRKESQITSSTRHGRKATMGGQGRKSMIPFKGDIIAYMSKRRDNNKFSSEYITSCNGSGETKSRGSHRKPCVSKLSQAMLDAVWLGYAAHFHTKYAAYPKHTILNADETGLYYDMPPGDPGGDREVEQSGQVRKTLGAIDGSFDDSS
ncbi:hypothetical protein DYB28_011050 [Aphanomyces astaci]|uniref:DDE-1 domain-containing protein n=1 Tax=Aphanomyces astaci TaxID=112090 RepID=A0A9X8EFR6_APHAT|nr:hypothetical protein DYB28_011050 [Aphanomyces astaci]